MSSLALAVDGGNAGTAQIGQYLRKPPLSKGATRWAGWLGTSWCRPLGQLSQTLLRGTHVWLTAPKLDSITSVLGIFRALREGLPAPNPRSIRTISPIRKPGTNTHTPGTTGSANTSLLGGPQLWLTSSLVQAPRSHSVEADPFAGFHFFSPNCQLIRTVNGFDGSPMQGGSNPFGPFNDGRHQDSCRTNQLGEFNRQRIPCPSDCLQPFPPQVPSGRTLAPNSKS